MAVHRVIVIAGPTAVGKTATAIRLAQRIGGEVVSGDSMQVYRGFDIGTAKPTPAEMEGVPHHLIDIKDPTEDFSVAEFQQRADAAIRAIAARGRWPIVAGGTGLYLRALLRAYTFAPLAHDPAVRAALEEEARRLGAPALHARLRQVDPEAAARIHPNDQLRIVRALEVYTVTGQPISRLQREGRRRYDALVVCLYMDREQLYERVNRRVDAMLTAGWLDEVRRLLAAGLSPYRSPLAQLGYRELVAYLRGLVEYEVAVDWIKRNTRRYARRQLTWWKRDPDVHWVPAAPGPEAAAAAIVQLMAGKWGPVLEMP